MAIEIDKIKNILAIGKSKEDINDLRKAILSEFSDIWIFHYYNKKTERRGLEVCNTWGAPIDDNLMGEINKFTDEFMINKTTNNV